MTRGPANVNATPPPFLCNPETVTLETGTRGVDSWGTLYVPVMFAYATPRLRWWFGTLSPSCRQIRPTLFARDRRPVPGFAFDGYLRYSHLVMGTRLRRRRQRSLRGRLPWLPAVLCGLLGGLLLGLWPGGVRAGEEAQLEASILRVKPAVVLISSEVGAEVAVNCGVGPVHRVTPAPTYETGSGFILHPDGFIATNGHVVERFFELNEPRLAKEFMAAAVAQACGPALAMVPEGARQERLRAIAADPANRGKVYLRKQLQVHLSTGNVYPAGVRAYSPAIKSEAPPSGPTASRGGKPVAVESGRDVAILKIEEHDLPTLRLATNPSALKLGEPIFVIGYPGVVLNHDFLSRKSQLEASVTVGRVSGFKIDLNDRRVIQTDAAITWGSSGGPAFNLKGEVIGVATFISTTLEGDQAIQGFNFLVPADSVHDVCGQIGVTPNPDTRFMTEWVDGVAAYFRGEYQHSLAHLDAAEHLMPGVPDIQRVRADAELRVDKSPRFMRRGKTVGLGFGAGLVAVLAVLGLRKVVSDRVRTGAAGVRRVGAEELRRRLDTGSGVTFVDARHGAKFDSATVQAAGAIRYDVEHPEVPVFRVQVHPDGEVVAYCDCPDEATSARVALQLMRAGYTRVSVVRGGFPALLTAGVPVAPKEANIGAAHARPTA